MFKYLRNSDLALRININPFNWQWKPAFAYDPPTTFMPHRKTYCITWLFLQLFVDLFDGVVDMNAYNDMVMQALDVEVEVEDEHEMGQAVPKTRKGSLNLE